MRNIQMHSHVRRMTKNPRLFEALKKEDALEDRRVLLNFPEKGKKEFALNARRLQSQDTNEHWIMPAIEEITNKKI